MLTDYSRRLLRLHTVLFGVGCIVGAADQSPFKIVSDDFKISAGEVDYRCGGRGRRKIGGYNVWLRGYNPLIATLSTPLTAPVIAATRLRAGNAASARGAAWQVAEAIGTARACGATGTIVVRADSAFYAKTVIWACRRNQAHPTYRHLAALERAPPAHSDETRQMSGEPSHFGSTTYSSPCGSSLTAAASIGATGG